MLIINFDYIWMIHAFCNLKNKKITSNSLSKIYLSIKDNSSSLMNFKASN